MINRLNRQIKLCPMASNKFQIHKYVALEYKIHLHGQYCTSVGRVVDLHPVLINTPSNGWFFCNNLKIMYVNDKISKNVNSMSIIVGIVQIPTSDRITYSGSNKIYAPCFLKKLSTNVYIKIYMYVCIYMYSYTNSQHAFLQSKFWYKTRVEFGKINSNSLTMSPRHKVMIYMDRNTLNARHD